MFALGTVLLCVATNIWYAIASRALQGLSSSIVFSVGLALLSDTVDHKDMGQFLGYFTSSLNLGLLASPFLGGIIYAHAGYYAVFALLFTLIFVDILLRLLLIEKKHAAKWALPSERGDSEHCTEDQAAQQQYGNLSANVEERNGSTETSPLLLATGEPRSSAYLEEGRTSTENHARSMPPLFTLLKSPRLLAAIYGIFINYFLIAAFDGVLPIFVNRTFGWSSLGAGLIFLCIALPALTAPLVGMLSDRYGPRWFAICGLVLTAPFVILLRLITHDGLGQVVLLCVLLSLTG